MVTLNPLFGLSRSARVQLTTAITRSPESPLGQLGLQALQPALGLRPFEQDFRLTLGGTLSTLNAQARALQSAAEALSQSGDAFTSSIARSSNEAVVTANASPGASPGMVRVTVSQLARAQENVGTSFTSSALNSFTTGRNTFAVTVGSQTQQVSMFVAPLDTNRTVLSNLAAAINSASLGLSARVEDNTLEGTSRLIVTGDETGTAAAFTLADVSGGIIAAAGAGTATTAAQNAEFTLNGVAGTSPTNTLVQDEGRLRLTLVSASATPVDVEVAAGPDPVISATQSFTAAVNRFRTFLDEHQTVLNPFLFAALDRELTQLRPALAGIGVTVGVTPGLSALGRDGAALSVDTEALRQAVETDPERVQEVLGGFNGLAERVASIAERVVQSPPAAFAQLSTAISPLLSLTQTQNLAGVVTDQLLLSGIFVNRLI